MKPIVHGLEARYADRMVFTYLDIDDARTDAFKAALGFRVQPQFFLLDGAGNILKQWFGFVPEEELAAAFEAVLK
jgi:thioredoxin-related protein